MRASEIIKQLSPEARQTLAGLEGFAPGREVPYTLVGQSLRGELYHRLGVVGPRGGLTMTGSIVAQKLQAELLDRTFS
jgi:hypothetical protein